MRLLDFQQVHHFIRVAGNDGVIAGFCQQHAYHVEPSPLPADFQESLERFVEVAGLWGLARRLRVSVRCGWRCKAGTRPDAAPGHACSTLSAEMGCSTSCRLQSGSRGGR